MFSPPGFNHSVYCLKSDMSQSQHWRECVNTPAYSAWPHPRPSPMLSSFLFHSPCIFRSSRKIFLSFSWVLILVPLSYSLPQNALFSLFSKYMKSSLWQLFSNLSSCLDSGRPLSLNTDRFFNLCQLRLFPNTAAAPPHSHRSSSQVHTASR